MLRRVLRSVRNCCYIKKSCPRIDRIRRERQQNCLTLIAAFLQAAADLQHDVTIEEDSECGMVQDLEAPNVYERMQVSVVILLS